MKRLLSFLCALLWITAAHATCPGGATCVSISGDVTATTGGAATVGAIGGKAFALGGALTTTGTAATTFALPSTGTPTFTFPSASKTLMASDLSNASGWPTVGDVLLAPTSGAPSGLAPTNGDLLFGSSGNWAVTALSAAIDAAIGSTQGDILYRGASTWAVLAPGTSGNFLETQGASANPQWASASGTPVVFVGAAGGAANAYTIASPTPSGYTLVNQYVIRTVIPTGDTNTGASTLNVNSTGALPIVTNSQNGLSALVGGELVAGLEYDLTYSTSSASACASSCYVAMALPGGTVQAGTTQTISAAQWAAATVFPVTTSGQTITLPASSGLSPNGGVAILTVGQSVTLAPTGSDDINGVNSSVTIPAGLSAIVVKSSAGNFSVEPLVAQVAAGGTGDTSLTSGAIYKGAGTSPMAASSITDNGTIVSSTEPRDLTNQPLTTEVANNGTTATVVNKLAILTGAPSTATVALTTSTTGVVGVVTGGAGTSGNAQIARAGQASCVFDGATTAGDYVQASTSSGGECHDTGASTYPTSNQVLGRVLSTNGAGGTYAMTVAGAEVVASSGGGSGSFMLANQSGGALGGGATWYCGLTSSFDLAASASCQNASETLPTITYIAAPRKFGALSGVTGSGFYVNLATAPGGSNTSVITLRIAGASTSVTCSVGPSATSCSDTTHSATATAGQSVDVQIVTGNTAANSYFQWALDAQ